MHFSYSPLDIITNLEWIWTNMGIAGVVEIALMLFGAWKLSSIFDSVFDNRLFPAFQRKLKNRPITGYRRKRFR